MYVLTYSVSKLRVRLGFGGTVASAAASPHPGDQSILVVFVVGGISYKEVGQVQAVLDLHNKTHSSGGSGRIVLMSTKTVNPENIFHLTYNI